MSRTRTSFNTDLRVLGGELQTLQQMLGSFRTSDRSAGEEAAWRASTRRNAERCLAGLQKLLDNLDRDPDKSPRTDGPSTARARILVADDNPANLALIEHQLEVLGWQADCAADGLSAFALWLKNRYGLVLIDKQMPGMDGLALAKAIRAEEAGGPHHVVLVGTTAGSYRDEIGPAQAAGMDDLLPKPIELNDLAHLLARWLPDADQADPAHAGHEEHPILDCAYVENIIGPIDASKRDHLINLFLATTETDLLAAHQQCRNYSGELLRRTLHKLKSAARMVGALRFAVHAEALEAQVRAGESAGVAEGLEWLAQECGQIRLTAERLLAAAPVADLLQSIAIGRMPGVVCVVDADALAREQLALMLVAHGWGEVRTYESGEAVFDSAKSGNPSDLVFCDTHLPGMNCIELLINLHERGFSGGILLTGGDDEKLLSETSHLIRTMGLEIWGELRKPYTFDAFQALLGHSPQVLAGCEEGSQNRIDREELLAAIHDDAFDIYFQPKVDSATLAVVGIEALARWRRDSGFVSPRDFIHAAEEFGLIASLSELLLIKALSGAAELAETGLHLPVSINLSSNWFRTAKVPELIRACATATGVATSDVTFELREDQMLDHLDGMKVGLQQLRKQGFQLAVDDLAGSRSDALERINHLSINELKLGHALVSGAEENASSRALLASCIAMAHRLNLSLVAEGVETDSELQMMRDMGCDHIQGWLIAKAMPVKELIGWLKGQQA